MEAEEALRQLPPHEHVDALSAIAAVLDWPRLPRQTDLHASFAEPPVTLYNDGDFEIQLLCWLDGATAIHHHVWSGAFAVWSGHSLQQIYRFDEERSWENRFRIGDLCAEECEFLSPGATRAVHPGDKLIHCVFHLDRPTVTLLVRRLRSWRAPAADDYLWPSVAYCDLFDQSRGLVIKRNQILGFIKQIDFDKYLAALEAHLHAAEPDELHLLLSHHRRDLCQRPDRFESLLSGLAEHRPRLIGALIRCFAEQDRVASIMQMRARQSDDRARTILAGLAVCRRRSDVLALLRHRYPDRNPIEILTEREGVVAQILGDSRSVAVLADLLATPTGTTLQGGDWQAIRENVQLTAMFMD